MDEPQGGVRHAVVGTLERRGGDVEHAHRGPRAGVAVAGGVDVAVRGGPGRRPVRVAERSAHPQHLGPAGHRRQARHHPAATAAAGEFPVVTEPERDGPPVGGDEYPAPRFGVHDREVRACPGQSALRSDWRDQLECRGQLHSAHPEGWRERPCEAPATTVTSGLLAGLRASCADVRSADLASRGAKRGLVTAGANSGPRPDGRRDR